MAVVFEGFVTLMFWPFFFSDIKAHFGSKQPSQILGTYLDHILPLFMLLVDFCLNRIYFEFSQFPINFIIIFIYGMVNMIVTLNRETPVYSIMPWDSFISVVVAFGMLPTFFLIWVTFHYLGKLKFSLIYTTREVSIKEPLL